MRKPAVSPNLNYANARRTQKAAEQNVVEAKIQLHAYRDHPELPAHYLSALTARVTWPTDSLNQLGAKLGISKDAYHGRLRRALGWLPEGEDEY